MYGVGVKTLGLKVVEPGVEISAHRGVYKRHCHLLLLIHVYLEADDVTILDLTLRKRHLAGSRNVDLANASELLVGDVEVLKEDHDGASGDLRLKGEHEINKCDNEAH